MGSGGDGAFWISPGGVGPGWGHTGVRGRMAPRHHVAPRVYAVLIDSLWDLGETLPTRALITHLAFNIPRAQISKTMI